MAGKKWTCDEEKFLRENYSANSIQHCAGILNRSPNSVKKHAVRLSISAKHERLSDSDKKYIAEWYSVKGPNEVSRVISKKRSTVCNFAKKNGIKMNAADLKRVKGENATPVVFTQEVRAKISAAMRKYDSPHVCMDCGKIINKRNQKRCNRCSLKSRAGESHMWWKGGKTNFYTTIASKLWYSWKKEILSRDNYECQSCGTHKSLQVHHIDRMRDIRDKVLASNPNLSVEKDKEALATLIVEAHKDARGITLCIECHRNVHFANGVNCWEALQGNQQPSLGGNAKEGPTTNGNSLKHNAMAMNRHERATLTSTGMI